MEQPKHKYVVGLAFSMDLRRLVLIRKRDGSFAEGMLNGPGGKIHTSVEYPINTNALMNKQWHDPSLYSWIHSNGGTFREETPHATMTRTFQKETGLFIPMSYWHCFHIQYWQHTRTKVYFFYTATDEITKAKTMTDEEVIISDHAEIPLFNENLIRDLPYIITMALTHVRNGDIFCLNPEGINLEKQNPTGIMG